METSHPSNPPTLCQQLRGGGDTHTKTLFQPATFSLALCRLFLISPTTFGSFLFALFILTFYSVQEERDILQKSGSSLIQGGGANGVQELVTRCLNKQQAALMEA